MNLKIAVSLVSYALTFSYLIMWNFVKFTVVSTSIFNVLWFMILVIPSNVKMICRVQDVAELLGMMVEDHKRLQPNVKTYA